jgi:hypothetical protein
MDNWMHFGKEKILKKKVELSSLAGYTILLSYLLTLADEKPGDLFTSQCIMGYINERSNYKLKNKEVQKILDENYFVASPILHKGSIHQYYKITRNDVRSRINNL